MGQGMGQKERKQSARGARREARDVTVTREAGAKPVGHAGRTGAVWTERTVLGLDMRGWRERKLDESQSRQVLEKMGEYVRDALASDTAAGAEHGAHGAPRTAARAADGSVDDPVIPPGCVLVRVEFRECADPQGLPHLCRCELYECPGQSFWLCTILD